MAVLGGEPGPIYLIHEFDEHLAIWKPFGIRVKTVQATTAIVDTVIVESTAIVEQNHLTTQFYLLLVESPL